VLLVGVIPMLIITQLSLNSASTSLDQQIRNQLDSVRDIKASAACESMATKARDLEELMSFFNADRQKQVAAATSPVRRIA
jgi:hypothetical protein